MISSASTNHPFLSRIKRKKNGRYGITVITFKPGEWQQLVGILEALLLSVLPQHPYLIQEPNTTTTHHISTPQNHQDLQEPKKKISILLLHPPEEPWLVGTERDGDGEIRELFRLGFCLPGRVWSIYRWGWITGWFQKPKIVLLEFVVFLWVDCGGDWWWEESHREVAELIWSRVSGELQIADPWNIEGQIG